MPYFAYGKLSKECVWWRKTLQTVICYSSNDCRVLSLQEIIFMSCLEIQAESFVLTFNIVLLKNIKEKVEKKQKFGSMSQIPTNLREQSTFAVKKNIASYGTEYKENFTFSEYISKNWLFWYYGLVCAEISLMCLSIVRNSWHHDNRKCL